MELGKVLANCLTKVVLPTCLAPRIIRGFLLGLDFQDYNKLNICLLKLILDCVCYKVRAFFPIYCNKVRVDLISIVTKSGHFSLYNSTKSRQIIFGSFY